MRLLNLLILCSIFAGLQSFSSSDPFEDFLARHPDAGEGSKWVVGCGKNPSAWTGATTVSEWSADGDHKHEGFYTMGTADVDPHVVYDILSHVFPVTWRPHMIYLEKLPPEVLGNPCCLRNVFHVLQPGGTLIFDVNISFASARKENSSSIFARGTHLFSLMHFGDMRRQIPAVREKLIEEGQPLGSESDDAIEKEIVRCVTHMHFKTDDFQKPINDFLTEIGFKTIKWKIGEKNPFNQRESQFVSARKLAKGK
jgi:hypothetical protein